MHNILGTVTFDSECTPPHPPPPPPPPHPPPPTPPPHPTPPQPNPTPPHHPTHPTPTTPPPHPPTPPPHPPSKTQNKNKTKHEHHSRFLVFCWVSGMVDLCNAVQMTTYQNAKKMEYGKIRSTVVWIYLSINCLTTTKHKFRVWFTKAPKLQKYPFNETGQADHNDLLTICGAKHVFRGFKCSKSVVGRVLSHWGGMTHICVSNLTNIGSDNALSPGRRQAII